METLNDVHEELFTIYFYSGQPANDYADPWAGAGPANLNSKRLRNPLIRGPNLGIRSNRMGLPDPNLKIDRLRHNQVNSIRVENPRMANRRLLNLYSNYNFSV